MTDAQTEPQVTERDGPEALRPQGCTNLKLRQLGRLVAAHYDAVVGRCGIKGTQYSLLSHVAKLGPIRPVELARVLRASPSTLSRNLQPLLEAGWVARQAAGDGRGHVVLATVDGHKKRVEAQALWKEAQLALNQRLGDAKVVALHRLLDDCMVGLTGPAAG